MTMDAVNLLKRLNPPVRAGASKAHDAASAPFESCGFDDLLTLVARGDIISDRPVTTAALADGALLTDAQQTRLAQAADTAEAGGFQRALLLIDGRAFVLEVASRMIDSEVCPGAIPASWGVDGAVCAAGDGASPAAVMTLLPGDGLVPARIHDQIERGRQAAAIGVKSRADIASHTSSRTVSSRAR